MLPGAAQRGDEGWWTDRNLDDGGAAGRRIHFYFLNPKFNHLYAEVYRRLTEIYAFLSTVSTLCDRCIKWSSWYWLLLKRVYFVI